ncbi:hypothetical protein LOAG_00044 [Loa loa]|uniref:Uncharacterized protein n=1 Tax=Loa loa TaxID=7209 RepID=A0A1S0UCT4_LOALO|nr:hypothetical protein LOAG_00044 [Loa loa]EFO28448.1 hypothetical protein LOAG_00044 [Loa loa]
MFIVIFSIYCGVKKALTWLGQLISYRKHTGKRQIACDIEHRHSISADGSASKNEYGIIKIAASTNVLRQFLPGDHLEYAEHFNALLKILDCKLDGIVYSTSLLSNEWIFEPLDLVYHVNEKDARTELQS